MYFQGAKVRISEDNAKFILSISKREQIIPGIREKGVGVSRMPGGCLVVAVVRMLGSAASLCEEHTGRLVDVSGVAVDIDIGHVGGVASEEVIEEASVVIGADINAKVGGVGAYAHGEVADRLVES